MWRGHGPPWPPFTIATVTVAFKRSLETRLGICIYKTSLLHRPDDYIGFKMSSHILQQNYVHDYTDNFSNGILVAGLV